MIQIPGMLRAMAVSPRVYLANPKKNAQEIAALLQKADAQGVSLCVFPELCLTGSTCGDLFYQDVLLAGAKDALLMLLGLDVQTAFIVGLPLEIDSRLYDCAAVISGKTLTLVPKTFPGREGRWFAPGDALPDQISLFGRNVPVLKHEEAIFALGDAVFGVVVGDDMNAPLSPAASLAASGALLLAHPCAEAETYSTYCVRSQQLGATSRHLLCACLHASAGYGESTTDSVYAGYTAIFECGDQLAEGSRFLEDAGWAIADVDTSRLRCKRRQSALFASSFASAHPLILPAQPAEHTDLLRALKTTPFIPAGDALAAACRDMLAIQTQALLSRMKHIGTDKLVIGVSGGLDSTLALLVAACAFDRAGWPRKNVYAITMPGLGTGERTKNNADNLMAMLGCTALEIPITPAVLQHFEDIGQNRNVLDICYENSQARERTQILMDYANKVGAIVLGTGDLSELALGFCTYNGDQMSMYNVNGGVPKTLMRALVMRISSEMDPELCRVVSDVVSTPISPELVPGEGELTQKTEEKLGAYELHDFFLWHMMDSGASPAKLFALAQHAFAGQVEDAVILKALRTFTWRFFTQQFKRSAMPDGPAIGSVSLSPRGGLMMPSDAQQQAWMNELDTLDKEIK